MAAITLSWACQRRTGLPLAIYGRSGDSGYLKEGARRIGLGSSGMPSIGDIAAEYVERAAALDPFWAGLTGIAGHDHEMPDLSADGFARSLAQAQIRGAGPAPSRRRSAGVRSGL
jgi:hypothetical protein